jgi:hypothetical protein
MHNLRTALRAARRKAAGDGRAGPHHRLVIINPAIVNGQHAIGAALHLGICSVPSFVLARHPAFKICTACSMGCISFHRLTLPAAQRCR